MEEKKKSRNGSDDRYALFEPDRLKDFIRFIEDRDIAEIEIKMDEGAIRISKTHPMFSASTDASIPLKVPVTSPMVSPPVPVTAPAQTERAPVTRNLTEVTAPLVGTFYASSSPDNPPFVKIGDTVHKGQILCAIEAMKVFNNIPSEVEGTVREICVKNEQPVEFGQVLFRVEV